MVRKLLICPWFGPLPEWMPKYMENIKALKEKGYDFLITHDLEDFNRRCEEKLGFKSPIIPGTGKLHDFRPALGLLYEEELKGYDFWGHTDFDCVYGRVDKFVTDELLKDLDIQSNHIDYICGPWTLYRNTPKINRLFQEYPHWKERMEDPHSSGWAEFQDGFTGVVDRNHNEGKIRRLYTYWQGKDHNIIDNVHYEGDRLMDGDLEIMMFHFRRVKQWPIKS